MGFRQMVFANKKGVVNNTPNTFIGGVAANISTPQLLADRLKLHSNNATFPVENILNFSVIGNDIQCRITTEYKVAAAYAFSSGVACSYYTDNDNLFKEIASTATACFEAATMSTLKLEGLVSIQAYRPFNVALIKELNFPNLLSCGNNGMADNSSNSNIRNIYIPLCTQLGADTNHNFVFTNSAKKARIYVHTSLETINAGSPDGDLVQATADGAKVRYIQNLTKPNSLAASNLGQVFGKAVQLIDNNLSFNKVDYFDEITLNGVPFERVLPINIVRGLALNTSYTLSAVVVDIYYNKSAAASISFATTATEPYPISNILSYIKAEDNIANFFTFFDDENAKNTSTSITYENGTVGRRAVFNGSNTILNAKVTKLIGDVSFTIVQRIKIPSLRASRSGVLTMMPQSTGGMHMLLNSNGSMTIGRWDGGTLSVPNTAYTLNEEFVFTLVFDKPTRLLSSYVNGTFISDKTLTGAQTWQFNGSILYGDCVPAELNFLGTIDEALVFDVPLTNEEITAIVNKLNSAQHLI